MYSNFSRKKKYSNDNFFSGNITRQPGYKNLEMKNSKDSYFNADNIIRGGVLLACHHGMNQDIFEYMHDTISEFIKSNS